MSFLDNIINTVKDNVLGKDENGNSSNLVMGILSLISNNNTTGLASELANKFGLNMNDGVLGQVSNFLGINGSADSNNTNSNVGGLSGLKDLLSNNGLAEQVKSWVGVGENLPVSPEQIQGALDSNGLLANLAEKAGVSKEQASGLLANILPNIIDKVTPDGKIPEDGLDLSSLIKQFIK